MYYATKVINNTHDHGTKILAVLAGNLMACITLAKQLNGLVLYQEAMLLASTYASFNGNF